MADLPSSGALSNATLTVGGFKTLIEDLRDSAGQGLTTFQLANTYEEGAITVTSNGVIYVSQVGSNAGNSPTVDDGSNWLAPPFMNYKGDWSGFSGTLYRGMAVSHLGGLWAANADIATASSSEPSPNNSDYISYVQPKMFDYTVSQLANGVSSDVGYIATGVDVSGYSYLIWPDDGRIYSVGSVTGVITAAFDPDDGSDAGLSGDLVGIYAVTPDQIDSIMIVKHTGASGTSGGAGTNSAWTDRTLNTESYNAISGASLTNDVVTLPAGKYKINAVQQFVAADDCISRLYSNTDTTTLLTGTAGFAGYNSVSSDTSTIEGVLELTAGTDVKLQYWFSGTTTTPYRLGRAVASGEDNAWAILKIEKIGDM